MLRLPGKLGALSLHSALYAAVDNTAAKTSELDSEAVTEHQGSLLCSYSAAAWVMVRWFLV